jgi:two-component system NarL family sensor kinase
MSKRPFSKTYPPKDKAVTGSIGIEGYGTSEQASVLQLQSQLELAQDELNFAAQEIHDNLGHLANLVHIHLKLLLETPDEAQQDKIKEISSLVADLNHEIKQLSINLTETSESSLSLDQLLHREVHRLKRLDLFKLVYVEPDLWPSVSKWTSLILFRMIQEILNNVLKHSKANLVQVEVSQTGSFLNLHLKDNGVGYDPTRLSEHSKLGVKHLYDRARAINAQLQVNSKQQQGTSVHIRMPLQ